ncbi:MAG TPA: hypothetical protein VHC22_33445 [Pirellulales bacterium]|nr:hypothetical protein [Pirellulales bacterium]
MNRSSDLSVSPVKRYRVAKYPSHADPDPTRVPYPVPYPWNSQAVVALASLGIAASCSREPDAQTAHTAARQDVAAAMVPIDQREPAQSPFQFANSGLPHVSSPFGTGAPNYLDDDLAREAIERVFREAGYHLRHRYQYDRNGLTFIADGYDPEYRIGYVYANYPRLDRDATDWPDETPAERVDFSLDQLADAATYEKDNEALREIASIQQLTDPVQRHAAYRAFMSKDRRDKLSLAEAKSLSSRAGSDGEFVALISHYDRRFEVPHYSDDIQAKLTYAALIPDPVKADAISEVIRLEAVQQVVDRLESAVRDYIAWARSQGLQ